jgi:uncharacterized protein DUF4384
MTRFGLLLLAVLPAIVSHAVAQDVQAQDVPRDLSIEQAGVYSAGAARKGPFKVSIGADRADGTYAIGETARLFISSNEDAYVTVFSVGPTGRVHQLFPNSFQTDNRVNTGRPVEIAGGGSGAHIAISGPVGAELIKVVASNKPIIVIPEALLQGREAFRTVEGGADTLAKNLEVTANNVGADRKVDIENYLLRTVASRRSDNGPSATATKPNPAAQAPVAAAPVAAAPVAAAPVAAFVLPVVTPHPLISIPPQQPFPFLLALDKAAYKVGERVTLAVTSLQACYLTVLDVTPSGTIRMLFPNQITQNNAVAAHQTVLVSGGPSPVSLQVSGPAGTEQIVAICSTDQSPVLSQKADLAQLFPPAGEHAEVMRDLSIATARPSAMTAVAASTFTVKP